MKAAVDPAWLDALRSSDWRTRHQAVERLAQAPPETLREHLIALLRSWHQDLNALNAALQLIARLGDPFIPSLGQLLDDPDPEVRLYAAQALGCIGHPAALPALLAHLDDPDPNVRFHVVEALALLQHPKTRPHLSRLVQGADPYLRYPALEGLARLHDPTLIPVMASLIADPDLTLPVADALGQTHCALAILPVIRQGEWSLFWATYARLYRDLPTADRLVRVTLAHLPPTAWSPLFEALTDQDTATQRAALSLLQGLLSAAPPPTLRAEAQQVVLSLWRQPDLTAAAEPVLRLADAQVVPDVVQALTEEAPPLAASAARLLGTWRATQALPALLQALQSREAEVAAAAAQALGRLGRRETAHELLASLDHPDAEVVAAALEALLTLRPPALAADLRARLHDPNPQVRAAALSGLARCDPAEAFWDLQAALHDPQPRVRWAAAQGLAQLGTPAAQAALREALDSPDPDLQSVAIQALIPFMGEEDRPRLHEGLRSPHLWVRLHACHALRRLAPQPATQTLLTQLLEDPLPPVRAAALQALAAHPSPALEEAALHLMTAEAQEVRLAALDALAACDSPRGVEAIRAALRTWPPEDHPFLWRTLARMTHLAAQQALRAALRHPQEGDAAVAALAEQAPPQGLPLLVEALQWPRWRAQARRGWLRYPAVQAREALIQALTQAPEEVLPALVAELRFLPPQVAADALRTLPAVLGADRAAQVVAAQCLVWRSWQQPPPPPLAAHPDCLPWIERS